MRIIQATGKTVELALQSALQELDLTEDKIQYDILDKGSKGFLGFGSRDVKIKVTEKETVRSRAEEFLRNILADMGVEATINIKDHKNILDIELIGDDMGILIGYRGETLDSIQYLTSIAANKGDKNSYKKIMLDACNYREKRQDSLRHLAYKMAKKVAKTRESLKLEPMNPYERRVIHSALQNDRFVKTYSEGEEPFRRVVLGIRN